MAKHDRAKMADRFGKLKVPGDVTIKGSYVLFNWAAREVDRAVRAERRAQRIATDEANKWREEAREKALRDLGNARAKL